MECLKPVKNRRYRKNAFIKDGVFLDLGDASKATDATYIFSYQWICDVTDNEHLMICYCYKVFL